MFIDGTYETLYIKDANGDWLPIACITANSFEESSDTIDTTTRDNVGWKTFLPTNQQYSVSFEALESEDVVVNGKTTLYFLRQKKRDRELIEWRIGSTRYIYGNGYITSLSRGYNIDENVSYAGSIIGFGNYNSYLEFIYNDYKSRIEAKTDGVIDSENCVLQNIDNLLR